MRLTVFNPTPFKRTQWLLYGSETPDLTLFKLPKSYVNVGKVICPASYKGPLDIFTDQDSTPFRFHDLIWKSLKKYGFQPALVDKDGSITPFQYLGEVESNNRCKVFRFRALHRNAVGILYVYVFHKSHILKLELAIYCQSYSSRNADVHADFKIFTNDLSQELPQIKIILRYANPDNLIHVDQMADTMGRRWVGSLIYYGSPEEMTEDEISSGLAEWLYPLYGVSKWTRWGPWGKQPIALTAKYRLHRALKLASQNYHDLFGHFGNILMKAPGSTGAQEEFGTWQSLAVVGNWSAEEMFFDQLAVNQESCRPIHYFEKDGEIVLSANHPNWVTWEERTHYNKTVSPDRLDRQDTELGNSYGWHGHDRQHYACIWLAEDVILNGSLLSREELKHKAEKLFAGETLPSKKPGWSTSGRGAARGIGRTYLGFVYNWLATGNEQLLLHAYERFVQTVKYNWTSVSQAGPMWVERIIKDPRYFANQPAWIPFEDALMVMGLDALAQALKTLKIDTSDIDNISWKLGSTIVGYGFYPDLSKKVQLVKAMVWDYTWKPPKWADYDDPSRIQLADGTDYRVWALPAVTITERMAREKGVHTIETRAKAIREHLELFIGTHEYLAQYLGAQ